MALAREPPVQKIAISGNIVDDENAACKLAAVLVLPHINRPLLYPDKKFHDFKYPEVISGDHWGEFVDACRGKGHTSASFNYAGPLTESVLLGGVASHFTQHKRAIGAA